MCGKVESTLVLLTGPSALLVCWLYYITNMDFPGDQRPVLKVSFAFFPQCPAI